MATETKKDDKVQLNVRLPARLARAVGVRGQLKGLGLSEMLTQIVEEDCAKYPKLMKTINELIEEGAE
jgi:hypothetical protein